LTINLNKSVTYAHSFSFRLKLLRGTQVALGPWSVWSFFEIFDLSATYDWSAEAQPGNRRGPNQPEKHRSASRAVL
jgi:hypothetical protein